MRVRDEGRSNAAHWYERAIAAEAEVAKLRAQISEAYEDGRISACNAGKPGCPRVKELEAKLAASEAACAPFLKDGETPAECIQRWRADAAGVLELLRQEKLRSEKVEAACAQMREALTGAVQALRTVGDDYPGSSCHEWCHKQADAYAAALATDAGKGWVSTDDAICTAVVADDGYVIAVLSEALAGSEVYIIRKGKP